MQYPSAQDINSIFNRIAPIYDQLNDSLSLGSHRLWKKMALRFAEPSQGEVWLDLCCGSGDMAGLLAQKVAPTGRVIGVDFAESQLAIAKHKFPAHVQQYIQWQVGDALSLQFASASFDGVTIAYGLRNVVDMHQCLREMYRVLKQGGRAVVLDFHLPDNYLWRQFQEFYLRNIVVPTAKLYGMEQEYAYIFPSLLRFPQGRAQEQLALNCGFASAMHYAIAGGMMGILVLTKG
jgi:demethylmenaquinone methyltransferase/2-methoxy-6-polyprenyl-1,4-benzoquinol methylase